MATKTVTFDPDSGVPFGVNLTVYGGSNSVTNLNVVDVNNNNYDFSNGITGSGATTNWSGSGQISKSVGTGASSYANATFTVGFTSAYDGKVKLSLGSTATAALDQGRYMFDVNVDSGSTVFKLVNGNVYVYSGISSAP